MTSVWYTFQGKEVRVADTDDPGPDYTVFADTGPTSLPYLVRAEEDGWVWASHRNAVPTDRGWPFSETATCSAGELRPLQDPNPARPELATIRQSILAEAAEIVSQDRNFEYGEPEDNFQNTADLINAQFQAKFKEDQEFTAGEVAVLMILLKLARVRTSPGKRDHWVDIAGYAACGGEVEENM